MSESIGHVFPPALVPILRERCGTSGRCVDEAQNDVLERLLTTVYFAGLETHEGERHPVRVVFLGRRQVDLVLPSGQEPGSVPIYAWKMLRFASVRAFEVPELVKLSVATAHERMYAAVRLHDDDRLAVAGLAREGISLDADPFLKIIVPRPGGLSIRSGRDRLVEYERGAILTGGESVVLAPGPIRSALESAARAAGLDEDAIADYLGSVRALVREMVAHGHGGLLVIDADERPVVAESAPYRVVAGSSLSSLLRLSKIIARSGTEGRARSPEGSTFGQVLRNAFVSEAERTIEELGALTAIDGATVLNRDLALIAFGAILPVANEVLVAEAADTEAAHAQLVDLHSRGTRHRAGAVYADQHPGSVVFVASEDGGVACMLRIVDHDRVTMWRIGAHVP